MGPSKCSGITKHLVADSNEACRRCKSKTGPIDGRTVIEVDVDGTMLDVEATFCYLGNMLRSNGGCDSAMAARCCVAWRKLRKFLLVLTTRHLGHRICGKMYEACICSAMLHGSDRGDQITLNCSGSITMTVPWSTASVESKTDEAPSASLLLKLGDNIMLVRPCGWLRWYDLVQQATSCI